MPMELLFGSPWCVPCNRPPSRDSQRGFVSCASTTGKGKNIKWRTNLVQNLQSLVNKEQLGTVASSSFILGIMALSSACLPRTSRFASLGLSLSGQTAKVKWLFSRLFYMLDVALERYPTSYFLMLGTTCLVLVVIGGITFYHLRSRDQPLGDCFWKAWSCLVSSGTHLREQTGRERLTGFSLAIGGLLFYSLLISTLTTQFKIRMELLREGAHVDVMETSHTVVCGVNSHLPVLIKQLNKYQDVAYRNRTATSRKQAVVLLSEKKIKNSTTDGVNKFKDCKALNLLFRRGSLSNTSSFQTVGAARASRIILLSRKSDPYEADADIVLSVLALQPLRETNPNVQLIAQVSKEGTTDLLKSLAGKNVTAVQNLSSKLLVQCSRQNGLIDVYQQLLDPEGQVISVRSYPTLAGHPYSDVRRSLQELVVCGLIREGSVVFHPRDSYVLQASDKLIVISEKDKRQGAPKLLNSAPSFESASVVKRSTRPLSKIEWKTPRKEYVVVLGWRSSVTEMVAEYDDYVGRGSELLILAQEPLKKRPLPAGKLKNIKVIQKVGNPLNEDDLRSALSEVQAYKSRSKEALSIVVIIDEQWQNPVAPQRRTLESDKQAVYALLLAESVCKELNVKVSSLVAELVDTKLGEQVVKSHDTLTFIGTSELMGLVTVQVADNTELNDIWSDLLNPIGDEIYVKDIFLYMKVGETPSFQELADRAVMREEVAIGYRMKNKIVINPPSKSTPLCFSDQGDSLVVISEFEYKKR